MVAYRQLNPPPRITHSRLGSLSLELRKAGKVAGGSAKDGGRSWASFGIWVVVFEAPATVRISLSVAPGGRRDQGLSSGEGICAGGLTGVITLFLSLLLAVQRVR